MGTLIVTISLFMVNFLNAQEQRPPFNIDLSTKQVDATIHTRPLIANVNNYNPFIRVFLPSKEKATGRAVLICPGGGYSMVVSGHEGYSWAAYFNPLGIAVIVLKYRLPNGNYKIPITDAEDALKMIKDSVKVWNINPDDVGIMGFSAGGHLASTIATHILPPLKPKFQILFYPVITMDKTYTHIGSHDNLLGKDTTKKIEDLYSNEKQITKDTPPAFIALAADDKVVPPANSINYFQALIQNNVFATLHIYPTGDHGWGFSKRYKYHEEILNELSLWLNEIK
jgi:acetyl esterase/lipase